LGLSFIWLRLTTSASKTILSKGCLAPSPPPSRSSWQLNRHSTYIFKSLSRTPLWPQIQCELVRTSPFTRSTMTPEDVRFPHLILTINGSIGYDTHCASILDRSSEELMGWRDFSWIFGCIWWRMACMGRNRLKLVIYWRL